MPRTHRSWFHVYVLIFGCLGRREERQKYKLALQQEMRKLKAEVKEIVKGFDEKIEEVRRGCSGGRGFNQSLPVCVMEQVLGFYLETEGAIYAQELYALRLALSVQSREVNLRKDHDLEAQLEVSGPCHCCWEPAAAH